MHIIILGGMGVLGRSGRFTTNVYKFHCHDSMEKKIINSSIRLNMDFKNKFKVFVLFRNNDLDN